MEDKDKKKETNEDFEFVEETQEESKDSKEVVERFRDRLKRCEADKQEYLQGWQKAKADLINARKRDEEKNQELIKFAKLDLILELIPTLDSFDLAFMSKEMPSGASGDWLKGVKSIHSQLLSILSSNGLRELDPIGQVFDPAKEEAVRVTDVDNAEKDNKILEVLQKGYSLHEKVIRSAKVVVGHYPGNK